MLHRPLQQILASMMLGVSRRPCIPRAVVLPRPIQHLQVPARGGHAQVISPHGQSCSRSHLKTSRCP